MYKNYQNFKKLSLFDFWLKLENKGGVEFFEWREEFHNAGQIFTPARDSHLIVTGLPPKKNNRGKWSKKYRK